MDKIKLVESEFIKKEAPKINVGDSVKVLTKLLEADGKVRLHPFEGVVIAKSGNKEKETFTVRKISYGEGVEMVFPLNSPSIDKIKVVKKGDVRRAKLYYLKRKIGKDTKVDEKIEHAKTQIPTPPREEVK